MYHLLNNFDTGCTICFHNSIMNNSLFVIILTLFSIDNAYDVPLKYIIFPILLYLFIYFIYIFFVDVLMYTCVIMRNDFWYLLVNKLMATVS